MWKVLLVTYLLPSLCQAKAPLWFTENSAAVRSRESLTVSCIGEGPSLDLARRSALDGCRNSAIASFGVPATIRSTSIETERDVAFHQEATESFTVRGLNCRQEKEYVEELENHYKAYLRCRYHLGNAAITSLEASAKAREVDDIDRPSGVSAKFLPWRKQEGDLISTGAPIQAEDRQLLLTTVPRCDSILVYGRARTRFVNCSGNPQKVQIRAGDLKLVVRAKNYLPAEVEVNPARGLSSSYESESLEVYLDPKP